QSTRCWVECTCLVLHKIGGHNSTPLDLGSPGLGSCATSPDLLPGVEPGLRFRHYYHRGDCHAPSGGPFVDPSVCVAAPGNLFPAGAPSGPITALGALAGLPLVPVGVGWPLLGCPRGAETICPKS